MGRVSNLSIYYKSGNLFSYPVMPGLYLAIFFTIDQS